MPRPQDITGQKFGDWTVLHRVRNPSQVSAWKCQCICGRTKDVFWSGLSRISKYPGWGLCKHERSTLIGEVYGDLTVLEETKEMGGNRAWLCKCVCGREKIVKTFNLKHALVTSCGCKRYLRTIGVHDAQELDPFRKDGSYAMLKRVRARAKREGIPFDLLIQDITIPTRCPVLGIPLFVSTGKRGQQGYTPNSPSLDRIDCAKGYTKGNVWVISMRANAIKNDATIEELKLIVSALEKKINERTEANSTDSGTCENQRCA